MAGRKKSQAVENETPEQKSKRLAEQRMNNAVKYIRLVGNLAGPGYVFTDEQREQILSTLQTEVAGVKDRFGGKQPLAAGFRLASGE